MSEQSEKAQIEAALKSLSTKEIAALESVADRQGTTLEGYIAEILKS